MPATAQSIDMTNVKEGGNFNTRRVPEGDYRLRILDVMDAEVKSGDNQGSAQWVFTLGIDEKRYSSTKYPYRCTLVEKQFWKIRNLLVAAGINVPKKRIKIDPNKLIGRVVAGTLEDDEYEGKERSQITAIFPVSELKDDEESGPDEDDEDIDEPEDEEAEAEPEEDEEEAEEEPEPEPVTKRTARKGTAAKKAAAKPRNVTRKSEVDEDELEELDIDDL